MIKEVLTRTHSNDKSAIREISCFTKVPGIWLQIYILNLDSTKTSFVKQQKAVLF